MSDKVPNYVPEVLSLARKLGNIQTYEQELIDRWTEFEAAAKMLKPSYDVLASDLPDYFVELMESFVKFLYRNGDASPQQDFEQVELKDAEYGGSWHARGGTGAFHALARKGDRIANQIRRHVTISMARQLEKAESIDDTIGDLRRYLLLVLGWHQAQRKYVVAEPPEQHIMSIREFAEDAEIRRG